MAARCQKIINIPGLAPGWGCCRCRVYNGMWRWECKHCGHPPCFEGAPQRPVIDGEKN